MSSAWLHGPSTRSTCTSILFTQIGTDRDPSLPTTITTLVSVCKQLRIPSNLCTHAAHVVQWLNNNQQLAEVGVQQHGLGPCWCLHAQAPPGCWSSFFTSRLTKLSHGGCTCLAHNHHPAPCHSLHSHRLHLHKTQPLTPTCPDPCHSQNFQSSIRSLGINRQRSKQIPSTGCNPYWLHT